MKEEREIYTGLHLFGNARLNSSCGGISAIIKVPGHTEEVSFFINNSHLSKRSDIDNAVSYDFSVEELETVHRAIERVLSDIRSLKSLSKRDLLRDEAYINPSQAKDIE